MNFDLAWILNASGGKAVKGPSSSTVGGFASDSRHKGHDWLFVAIKGEKADGHDYLGNAFENGARSALVSRIPDSVPEQMSLILVDDVISSLGLIAKAHRQRFTPTVFGVTGSAGKTTTKDMTAAVLGTKYEVLKTHGNLNTEVGCPLTLLRLEPSHEVAVIEMAMLDFGQIRYLTEIARPKKGIVTIVGSMHMEFLGSKDGIAKAKQELVEALPEDGLAMLNHDDERVLAMHSAARCSYLTYGLSDEADVRASGLSTNSEGTSFDVKLSDKATSVLAYSPKSIGGVRVPFAGSHQVRNALAAICAGLSEGITEDQARQALATFKPSAMRMTLKKSLHGFEVLDDSYNANPESVPAAVESALAMAGSRPLFLVLGGMVELGEGSLEMHRGLGKKLSMLPLSGVITMGSLGHGIFEGLCTAGYGKATHTESHGEAAEEIEKIAGKEALVLVKGSRAIGMDKVVGLLTGEKETAH